MKNSVKRGIMNSLARLDLTDDEVILFIKELADNQDYKVESAYENFCVNCAIHYTSSMFVMMRKMKLKIDVSKWENGLIERAEDLRLVK